MCLLQIINRLVTSLFGNFGSNTGIDLNDQEMEQSDVPDGNCIGRKQEDDTDVADQLPSEDPGNDNSEIYVPVSKYAFYYKMDHDRRGLALIFNHQNFVNKCPKRHGTNVDCEKLRKCFQDLHFDVHIFNDLNEWEIRHRIQRITRADHSNADCLVLVVLTHGSPNILYACDGDGYNPQEVFFDQFTADNCRTLAGKPKIFIMQACQGDALDDGIQVIKRKPPATEFDGGLRYSIPIRADFLIVYATSKGHYAFRNTQGGSYFVTVLCEELLNNAAKYDLLHILTFVNQRVAVEFESSNTRDPKYHNKKQMPYFQSYLTRFIHFGNYEQRERDADPVIHSTRPTRRN